MPTQGQIPAPQPGSLFTRLTEIASNLRLRSSQYRKKVVTPDAIGIYGSLATSSPGTGLQAALSPSWAKSGGEHWPAAPGCRADRHTPNGLSKW